jgi:tetratricopeptide (TPR) repeat protein
LQAAKRADAPTTVSLLRRATALLPTDDEARRSLLCELGVGLGTRGDADAADRAFAEAVNGALVAGDRGIELRARVEIGIRRVLTEPEGAAEAFLALAADALPVFEQLGDERALGRTWMLTGWVQGGVHGQNHLWAQSARSALDHYRRSGWPSSSCLGQLASALYLGPTPAVEAIAECDALLAQVQDFAGEASVRARLGGLEAMRGRFELAYALLCESRELFDELGQTSELARICGPTEAAVHVLAGRTEAAERVLRESCALLSEMRDANLLATRAAELAEALYRQGRLDEAERWTGVASENASSDDIDALVPLLGVRAKVLARRGEYAEGEVLARKAIALAEFTDALNRQASVRLDLAEVLWLGGSRQQSLATAEEAARLFDVKGNVVDASRARTLFDVGVPA